MFSTPWRMTGRMAVVSTAVPRTCAVVMRSATPVVTQASSATRMASMSLRSRYGSNVGVAWRRVAFGTRVNGSAARRKFSTNANGGDGAKRESLREMYMRWLTERPILTKCVTSGLISCAGDVVCQFTIEDAPFNFRRCFNMTLLGTALVGPGLHYWYSALASWIPGTTTAAVLGRLALDQLVWAPAFIAVFFSSMSILQGKPEEIVPNLKQNVWSAMIVNWKLWPAANFINFKFVPVQLQVLFANFVALIWNTYLSWATSRGVVVEDDGTPASSD